MKPWAADTTTPDAQEPSGAISATTPSSAADTAAAKLPLTFLPPAAFSVAAELHAGENGCSSRCAELQWRSSATGKLEAAGDEMWRLITCSRRRGRWLS